VPSRGSWLGLAIVVAIKRSLGMGVRRRLSRKRGQYFESILSGARSYLPSRSEVSNSDEPRTMFKKGDVVVIYCTRSTMKLLIGQSLGIDVARLSCVLDLPYFWGSNLGIY